MALFLDGPVATVDTLTQYDSNVLSVAASEGINLTTKILLSQEAMHLELVRLLVRSQLSGVCQSRGIGNVAWSKALRVWQVYQSLSLIYQDAFYSQLNDRNRSRAKEFGSLANGARRDLVEHGLELVSSPLRRPQQPIAGMVPASEPGGTYYFAVTYGSECGQESSPSSVLSVDVTDGNAVDLTIFPELHTDAVGWNLYAGQAPDQMFLQNDGLLDFESDWAYLVSTAVSTGKRPGLGQAPDVHWPLHRFLQRG